MASVVVRRAGHSHREGASSCSGSQKWNIHSEMIFDGVVSGQFIVPTRPANQCSQEARWVGMMIPNRSAPLTQDSACSADAARRLRRTDRSTESTANPAGRKRNARHRAQLGVESMSAVTSSADMQRRSMQNRRHASSGTSPWSDSRQLARRKRSASSGETPPGSASMNAFAELSGRRASSRRAKGFGLRSCIQRRSIHCGNAALDPGADIRRIRAAGDR